MSANPSTPPGGRPAPPPPSPPSLLRPAAAATSSSVPPPPPPPPSQYVSSSSSSVAPPDSDSALSKLYNKTDDKDLYGMLISPEVQAGDEADIPTLQRYCDKYASRLFFDYNGQHPSLAADSSSSSSAAAAAAAEAAANAIPFARKYAVALSAQSRLALHVEALAQALFLVQLRGGRRLDFGNNNKNQQQHQQHQQQHQPSDRIREEALRVTECVLQRTDRKATAVVTASESASAAAGSRLATPTPTPTPPLQQDKSKSKGYLEKSLGTRAFFDRCLAYSWDLRLQRLKVLHEVIVLSTRRSSNGSSSSSSKKTTKGEKLKAFCDDFLNGLCKAARGYDAADIFHFQSAFPSSSSSDGDDDHPNYLPLLLHLLLRVKATYVASLTEQDPVPVSLPLADSLPASADLSSSSSSSSSSLPALRHRQSIRARQLECQEMLAIANTLMWINSPDRVVVCVDRRALREVLVILNDCDFFAAEQQQQQQQGGGQVLSSSSSSSSSCQNGGGPSLRSLASSLMSHCIFPHYNFRDVAANKLLNGCRPNDRADGRQEAMRQLVAIHRILVPGEMLRRQMEADAGAGSGGRDPRTVVRVGGDEGLNVLGSDVMPPDYSQSRFDLFGNRCVGVLAWCSLLFLFREKYPDNDLFNVVFPHEVIQSTFTVVQNCGSTIENGQVFQVMRADVESLNPRTRGLPVPASRVALRSKYADASFALAEAKDPTALTAVYALVDMLARVVDKPETSRIDARSLAVLPSKMDVAMIALLVQLVEVVFLNQPTLVDGFWARATTKKQTAGQETHRLYDPVFRLLEASKNCSADLSLYFRLLASFSTSRETTGAKINAYDKNLSYKLQRAIDSLAGGEPAQQEVRALVPVVVGGNQLAQLQQLQPASAAQLLLAIARIYSLSPPCDSPGVNPMSTCRQLYNAASNAAASNNMEVCYAALCALAALSSKPQQMQQQQLPPDGHAVAVALDWDAWPLAAACCISDGGGWGFLHSGSQLVVAAGLRLFGSLAAATLALAEASDPHGASGCAPLLLCLQDGAEAVCDVLSRAGETWHYPSRIDRWELESVCLRCLTALLTSSTILSAAAQMNAGAGGAATREAARIVQERLLQRLSSDSLLGEAIGGCATLAVSSALRGSVAFKADLEAEDKSESYCWKRWNGVVDPVASDSIRVLLEGERKPLLKDLNLNHGVLGLCESAEKDFIVKLAEDAMDLILAWFDASPADSVEKSPAPTLCASPKAAPECLIGLEGGEESSFASSALLVSTNTALLSSSSSYGTLSVPSTLSRTTTLNLISVYAGPRKSDETDVGDSLALSSLEVIRRTMSFQTSSFVEVLDGGSQLAAAFTKFLVPPKADEADVDSCLKADLALASLSFLGDAVTLQPVLASKIFQDKSFAQALVECLHSKSGWVKLRSPSPRDAVVGFSLHPSAVAAKASDCVAVLWESCRWGDQPTNQAGAFASRKNRTALDEAKRYLRRLSFESGVSQQQQQQQQQQLTLFEALVSPFNDRFEPIARKKTASPLSMMQVSEHCARLQLLSSALRTISIEIHGHGNGGESDETTKKLTEFLEQAAAPSLQRGVTKYEEWTSQFMVFDGRTLDELKEGGDDPSVALVRARKRNASGAADAGNLTFVDAGNLIFGLAAFTQTPSDQFEMDQFDLKRAFAVMASIRGGGSCNDIVRALERHNAVRDLASSQVSLIKSWKRFMEVSVLRQQPSSAAAPPTTKDSLKDKGSPKSVAQKRLPGSPAHGAASNFSGDFRSYRMVLHTSNALLRVSEPSSSAWPGGGATIRRTTTTTSLEPRRRLLRLPASALTPPLSSPVSWPRLSRQCFTTSFMR